MTDQRTLNTEEVLSVLRQEQKSLSVIRDMSKGNAIIEIDSLKVALKHLKKEEFSVEVIANMLLNSEIKV